MVFDYMYVFMRACVCDVIEWRHRVFVWKKQVNNKHATLNSLEELVNIRVQISHNSHCDLVWSRVIPSCGQISTKSREMV